MYLEPFPKIYFPFIFFIKFLIETDLHTLLKASLLMLKIHFTETRIWKNCSQFHFTMP